MQDKNSVFSLRILVAGKRCNVAGEYLKEAPCLNKKNSHKATEHLQENSA